MQYNRTADGEMLNLPKPSVDTGMGGLERIAAVLQGVHSNYEIDLFQDLLKAASDILGGAATTEASLRVVADHIRSCAFLIADGVMPSNEGRGFVLRRIIRRAARHGNKLGATQPFFYKLTGALVELMGEAYPQLVSSRKQIEKVLLQEEEQFAKTLDKGLRLLEQDIAELKGTEIPGETVFTLYDTYGFPVDLTNDIARERGLTLDYEATKKPWRPSATGLVPPASLVSTTMPPASRLRARPSLPVMTMSMVMNVSARCWSTVRSATRKRVMSVWWYWSARRSTRSLVARWVIPAC